jgi:SAM-dependent methyltransferase
MNDYNYQPSIFSLENYIKSDIGLENALNIYNITQGMGYDNIFVDLGVWHGFTSHLLLLNSLSKNNLVFGVDVKFDDTDPSVLDHSNFTKLLGDSSTIGKNWNNGPISFLFIDTLHVKEQVLCELYHWYDHVREGGLIVFHDTSWPADKFDNYWDINWQRPEEAIKIFFGINSLIHEDDYIQVISNNVSNGMTFVVIKKKFPYKERINNWREIFDTRNFLTSKFDFAMKPGFIYETI